MGALGALEAPGRVGALAVGAFGGLSRSACVRRMRSGAAGASEAVGADVVAAVVELGTAKSLEGLRWGGTGGFQPGGV